LLNLKKFCFGIAAALVVASAPAGAQVYSWKDPATGQSKFSNIAPSWYSRHENVSGPRVIATIGGKVIDDTALPYADRLLLSGKSRDYIEKMGLQHQQGSPARQQPNRESAPNQAAGKRLADEAANSGAPVRRKGS